MTDGEVIGEDAAGGNQEPAPPTPPLATASFLKPQTTSLFLTIPMCCRDMDLLGVVRRESNAVFFCVHQVSVELWRKYDTPRVSVQKKIIDLRIQLTNSNREQIGLLRKAGIIEGFRATMIGVRDTERLFDALEYSRKKRGLEKHALKTNCDPRGRQLRLEEKRARRLQAKTRPLDLCIQMKQCALNENTDVLAISDAPALIADTGKLLVARDAEDPCLAHKHDIETLENRTEAVQPVPRGCGNDAVANGPTDFIVTHFTQPMERRYLQAPITTTCASVLDSPKATSSVQLSTQSQPSKPTSRLSSPTLESSELSEERSSTYSYTSLARSSSASPRTYISTPERFLFLDSDSEQGEAREERFHPGTDTERLLSQEAGSKSDLLGKTGFCGVHIWQNYFYGCRLLSLSLTHTHTYTHTHTHAHSLTEHTQHRRKPATLKLLQIAQASSPPINRPAPPSPLLVSISLSMLSISGNEDTPSGQEAKVAPRRRRGVALSSFATKKRAEEPMLQSPSLEGDTFESGVGLPPPSFPVTRGRGRPRGSRGRGSRRGRKPSTPATLLPSPSLGPGAGNIPPLFPESTVTPMDFSAAGSTATVSTNCNSNNHGSQAETNGLNPTAEAFSPTGDDQDQLSIASSSTSSKAGCASVRRSSRQSCTNPATAPEKPAFSFESLFNFSGPPKLVVRNGELVPESTLSTRGMDRQFIPENHPVFNWSMGQPVKGAAAVTRRRKKKQHTEE